MNYDLPTFIPKDRHSAGCGGGGDNLKEHA